MIKLTRDDVIARHAQKQGFASHDLSGQDVSVSAEVSGVYAVQP